MKLFCLSGHTNKPCHVLRFKQCTIMLDCSLDETSLLNYLPVPLLPCQRLQRLPTWRPKESTAIGDELRECSGRVFVDTEPEFCVPQTSLLDLSEVDVILVSNYTALLALPYLVADCGFAGIVYATAPTVQLGRLFMDELVTFVERSQAGSVTSPPAAHWKQAAHLLPPPLCHVYRPQLWRRLYGRAEVAAALSHVHTAGYGQRLDVFGAVHATAYSSGYCIGSANWVLATDHEKIVYVNGSTTLTTHPNQLDQSPLRGAQLMIMSSLTQVPGHNPDAMIGEFCAKVAATVAAGGCVLVPCWPSGIVYDLLECLAPFLDQQGLASVPLLFVSPAARRSLAFSNILAEWLSPAKQQRVYLPEDPFPHGQLLASGRLRAFDSLHADGFSAEFRQPCVVFCGHPSLRLGDSVHLMELWSSGANNAIIFTAPDFNYADCLAPYQPMAMKCYFTPIDTSLFYSQANKLLRELKPAALAVPHQYVTAASSSSAAAAASTSSTTGGDSQQQQQQLEAPHGCHLMTYRRGDVLRVPLKRTEERVTLSRPLTEAMQVKEVRPGVAAATITARLSVRDNRHWLHPLETPPPPPPADARERTLAQQACEQRARYLLYGTVALTELTNLLNQHHFADVKVEESYKVCFVHLQRDDVLIQLEKNSTHIIGEPDENVRQKLRDIVVECLNKL